MMPEKQPHDAAKGTDKDTRKNRKKKLKEHPRFAPIVMI
jgi:hypothetical protein